MTEPTLDEARACLATFAAGGQPVGVRASCRVVLAALDGGEVCQPARQIEGRGDQRRRRNICARTTEWVADEDEAGRTPGTED